MKKNKKAWSGRFQEATDALVESFTSSIQFDHVLYKYDIRGSIAHCRMLKKQKIIAAAEADRIIAGLKEIEQEIAQGKFTFTASLEDVHMHIESRLIQKIGPAGGRLHTARSRNDQVALDVSLYLRDAVIDTVRLLDRLQETLLTLAENHIAVIMPGFTHLQHAQPVLFSHHLMAYYEMFTRDRERMESCHERVNRMPLGAAALAGTPYPIDREYVAQLLGYPGVTANSIDSVSDRDTLVEFCSDAAIIMMHLSRFCEELIIWSSPEFRFVELSDAFCTGSSIMPQKKNPDVAELVRGKTGRVYGNLTALFTIMKALPLSYNRDLQEDKEALFDTVATVSSCLAVFTALLRNVSINGPQMKKAAQQGFITATDLADYLATHGIPFRDAHEITGRVVASCIRDGKTLEDISLAELRKFSPVIAPDALEQVTIEHSINSRAAIGGTAHRTVQQAIRKARAELKKQRRFIETAERSGKRV
jgi:argininosuccinate lyase